jgi:hypothetical protein
MIALLRDLYVLLKTAAAHGAEHPLYASVAERLVGRIAEVKPPFSLQFVRGGVFWQRELLAMDAELYERATVVARSLDHLDVHEITVSKVPKAEGVRAFGVALGRGMLGPSSDLDTLKVEGMSWRRIPNASWGEDQEDIDAELFALTQIALAVQEADALHAACGDGWSFKKGLSIVRRLERAMEVEHGSAVRAIELAPGGWTPARRAVSAALGVAGALLRVGASKGTRRSAAHAALALGMYGLAERAGEPVDVAARRALAHTIDAPATARTGVSPHRLRASVVIHQLANAPVTDWLPVCHVIQLCYELEVERAPEGVGFDLTLADLMALAAQDMGTAFAPTWVKVLIDLHGEAPCGAYARTPGGEVGVVLGPCEGGHELLVGARVVVARGQLELVTSAQAHGFD